MGKLLLRGIMSLDVTVQTVKSDEHCLAIGNSLAKLGLNRLSPQMYTSPLSLSESNRCRSTIRLRSGITLTPTSSSIGNIGTWPPVSPTTACGESLTVNSAVSLVTRYSPTLQSQVLIHQLIA